MQSAKSLAAYDILITSHLIKIETNRKQLTTSISSSACSYIDFREKRFFEWCNFEFHVIRSFRCCFLNSDSQLLSGANNGFGFVFSSIYTVSMPWKKRWNYVACVNLCKNGITSWCSGFCFSITFLCKISFIGITLLIRLLSDDDKTGPYSVSSISFELWWKMPKILSNLAQQAFAPCLLIKHALFALTS